MTRELAKRKIEMLDSYLQRRVADYGESDHEAMMMAIKALEQEPCEDAISRAEVLSIYDEWFATCDISDKKASPKAKIKALPFVQPKMGHWIKITPSGIYMCSECGQNVLTGDIDAYHYCHHCGARMINPHAESEEP